MCQDHNESTTNGVPSHNDSCTANVRVGDFVFYSKNSMPRLPVCYACLIFTHSYSLLIIQLGKDMCTTQPKY